MCVCVRACVCVWRTEESSWMRDETVTYDTALRFTMTWMTGVPHDNNKIILCVYVFMFSVQPLREDFECEPPAAPLGDEESSNIQPDDCTPSPEILPSGVILVRPHSSTENKMLLEDQELPVR